MFVLLMAGLGVLTLIMRIVIDVCQTRDTIRQNYTVIGPFRHAFSELAEFFRGHSLAMGPEGMPFSHAKQGWIDRGAKGQVDTDAFGFGEILSARGMPTFVNYPVPTLDEDTYKVQPLVRVPYCKAPHDQPSFLNLPRTNSDEGNFQLCWCRWTSAVDELKTRAFHAVKRLFHAGGCALPEQRSSL